MKAIVYEKYGPPEGLELREVDRPDVHDGDVLVRVRAASVNSGDWRLLTATPWVVRLFWGLFRPRRGILGWDFAGRVEAVGGMVTKFQPGDEVFGASGNAGAFAEYVCVREDGVVSKPGDLSDEEAAAVPTAAATALQGLRDKGRIQPGHKVLINGASGGVGTFAVQIAKSFGAEVTAVCSVTKLDLARSIGADHTIDYTKEDFTQSNARYDLVLDIVGNHTLADCKRTLSPEGIYVAASGGAGRSLWIAMTGGKKMVAFIAEPKQENLLFLRGLLQTGKLASVIDRRYRLREVPEAIRYIGDGHARGKVVITV